MDNKYEGTVETLVTSSKTVDEDFARRPPITTTREETVQQEKKPVQ
jgi:hypothetical protein